MEITLLIAGEPTTFKQEFISVATMLEAAKWYERYDEQTKLITKMSTSKIDDFDEEEMEEAKKLFDVEDNIDASCRLIELFFNGQFTYDDLLHGSQFKNVSELHEFAMKIYALAFREKSTTETKATAKKSPRKSAS